MESFLESLLPLLIAVAFVGSRIVLMLRRQRARRGQEAKAPGGTATRKPARSFVSWEDEFRDDLAAGNARTGGPAQSAAADEDEAFSAWNLSVDDEPPAPDAPPRPPRAPGSDSPVASPRFPKASGQDLFVAASAASPRFPEAPGLDSLAAASAASPRFPEAPGLDSLAAAPARSSRERLERRFHGLPFLQRGLVWAEILGAPKGLQD